MPRHTAEKTIATKDRKDRKENLFLPRIAGCKLIFNECPVARGQTMRHGAGVAASRQQPQPCHPILAPPRMRLAVWLHCPGGFRPRTAARPAPAPVEYLWRNTGPVHKLSMSGIDRCVFMSRGHGCDHPSYVGAHAAGLPCRKQVLKFPTHDLRICERPTGGGLGWRIGRVFC